MRNNQTLTQEQKDVDHTVKELILHFMNHGEKLYGLNKEQVQKLTKSFSLFRIFNHYPEDNGWRDREIESATGIKPKMPTGRCENCGKSTTRKNKWDLWDCGQPACLKALSKVGKSKESAEWYKRQNNPKKKGK